MRPAIRLFIVAAICLQLQTVSSFLSFQSKFSKKLNLFKEEKPTDSSDIKEEYLVSPANFTYDPISPPTTPYLKEELESITEAADTTVEDEDIPDIETISIDFTPEEYKEYFAAVTYYRNIIWNNAMIEAEHEAEHEAAHEAAGA